MAKQMSAAAPGQVNMIGAGTVLEGTLTAQSDVRVSGKIIGQVQVEGKVIVAHEGTIDGELSAAHADVAGTVLGEIDAADRVVLRSSARVEGNIKTARLVMEEGALFDGKCVMGQTSIRSETQPIEGSKRQVEPEKETAPELTAGLAKEFSKGFGKDRAADVSPAAN